MDKGWFEIPPEDQDEYIPKDSEFWEALEESARFGEIYPPFLWYFTQWKKSYFNAKNNLWSKKKQLSSLTHTLTNKDKKYQYAGYINNWITAIPLPEGTLPDTDSICFSWWKQAEFFSDQNNCVYLKSTQKQYISFDFAFWQTKNSTPPLPQDTENIIFKSLTPETEKLLQNLQNKTPIQQAQTIRNHIITTKKYNTDRQWTLRNISNEKNYLTTLDQSPILECYSANTLFVWLCRKLGIPAKLIVGHMVQSVGKNGKSHLSSNNGHAWAEIWDQDTQERTRFDATPTQKENGEESNQNHDQSNQDSNQQNQSADNNMDNTTDNQNQQSWDQSWGQSWWQNTSQWWKEDSDSWNSNENTNSENQSWNQKSWWQSSQSGWNTEKSAGEMLDELIEKAKEESLIKQAENIKDTLEKLEQAKDKGEIKDILDEAELEDFWKDLVDKIWNDGILEQEKKELEELEKTWDEKQIEQALENSLLNPEHKKKLEKYANTIKEKITEQKSKMKTEMEKFGFKEEELQLYKQYKKLEREVEPQVRQQINELQKLLPPKRQIVKDEDNYYRSGARLDRRKLVDRKVTGNTKIFQRNNREHDTREINMFETILIDRSWSMGSFSNQNSPIREAVKTAIIRAKVLEYFKVQFSIQFFDDTTEEIMTFGENFSDRKKCHIPSKLMRAVQKSWGTNIGEPLSYTYTNMKEYARKNGHDSFWNITFLGDGKPISWLMWDALKQLITTIRKDGFWLTAYYINGSKQHMNELQQYFWTTESWWTVLVDNLSNLTKQVIGNYNNNLRKIVNRYTK